MKIRSLGAGALALMVALSSASAVSAATVAESLMLQPSASGAIGATVNGALDTGTANVDVDVVTLGGGYIRTATTWDGSRSFDYPRYVNSSTPPRAVLRVRNSGGGDDLAPARADFVFGADFTLDRDSTGSTVDDGDNLVQRGTFGSASQYKIDVDGGRVSCRIKGSSGAVTIKSSLRAKPGLWYRVRCARSGNDVQVTTTEYRGDGTSRVVRDEARGSTGSLKWVDSRAPMSVGGKLTRRGDIVRSSTDQFNGSVGRVVFRIYS
ncbi:MAG: LamG domain-containing protein [Ornithinimicrobium sp.]